MHSPHASQASGPFFGFDGALGSPASPTAPFFAGTYASPSPASWLHSLPPVAHALDFSSPSFRAPSESLSPSGSAQSNPGAAPLPESTSARKRRSPFGETSPLQRKTVVWDQPPLAAVHGNIASLV
jgi:hypothetical protein